MKPNDGGVAGKNHGGPGWDMDPNYMPQNRRNTHKHVEVGLEDAADRQPYDEGGYGGSDD